MTINQAETIIYERLDETSSPAAAERPEATFPTLFWAGVTLFAVNALILFGVWLSPEMTVGVYGMEHDNAKSLYKPSPFTERVETAPARPVKTAEKVVPILYREPEPMDESEFGLVLPRSTYSSAGVPSSAVAASIATPSPAAGTVTGAAVNSVVNGYSDFPRVTASLNPAAPGGVAHAATLDVAPRRVSEQVVRTSIN